MLYISLTVPNIFQQLTHTVQEIYLFNIFRLLNWTPLKLFIFKLYNLFNDIFHVKKRYYLAVVSRNSNIKSHMLFHVVKSFTFAFDIRANFTACQTATQRWYAAMPNYYLPGKMYFVWRQWPTLIVIFQETFYCRTFEASNLSYCFAVLTNDLHHLHGSFLMTVLSLSNNCLHW